MLTVENEDNDRYGVLGYCITNKGEKLLAAVRAVDLNGWNIQEEDEVKTDDKSDDGNTDYEDKEANKENVSEYKNNDDERPEPDETEDEVMEEGDNEGGSEDKQQEGAKLEAETKQIDENQKPELHIEIPEEEGDVIEFIDMEEEENIVEYLPEMNPRDIYWNDEHSLSLMFYKLQRSLRKLPERMPLYRTLIDNLSTLALVVQNPSYAYAFARFLRAEGRYISPLANSVTEDAARHFELLARKLILRHGLK
ncbi:unnamed protein product [Caenorhabditis bovis]|nr:unnamed protein product [Caenorhabditis bovis]